MSKERHPVSWGLPRAQKNVLYLCDSQRYPIWAIEEISHETDTIMYRELRDSAGTFKGSLGVVTKEDLTKLTAQGYCIIVDPFVGGGRKE